MKVDEYLSKEGISRSDLAEKLGVSRQAVYRWIDIPDKYLKSLLGEVEEPVRLPAIKLEEPAELPEGVVSREWRVVGDKLHWCGEVFGHGSEWDYNYSPARISYIRDLLKQFGSVQAVYEWVQPVQFDKDFITAVSKDTVCPIVIDMLSSRVGGGPVPKRVYPFEVGG